MRRVTAPRLVSFAASKVTTTLNTPWARQLVSVEFRTVLLRCSCSQQRLRPLGTKVAALACPDGTKRLPNHQVGTWTEQRWTRLKESHGSNFIPASSRNGNA